jgi:thiol-disulfide isomerase/thioredoxin
MHINVDSKEQFNKLDSIIKKKEPVLVLYFGEWCSYCKEFKPMWDEFIKICKIKTAEIESELLNLSSSKNHSVSSFPTIKLFVNGKLVLFEKERSIDNLNTFVNSSVKTKKPKKKITKKITTKKISKK